MNSVIMDLKTMNLLDTKFLFANMFWGSVATGYCIYGKRQGSLTAFVGGLLMFVVSCAFSAFWMSVLCIALMVAVYKLVKRGL